MLRRQVANQFAEAVRRIKKRNSMV